jgi:hypothetical protein
MRRTPVFRYIAELAIVKPPLFLLISSRNDCLVVQADFSPRMTRFVFDRNLVVDHEHQYVNSLGIPIPEEFERQSERGSRRDHWEQPCSLL